MFFFAIGIPANVKGFKYISDAMDIYENDGCGVSTTKWLYPEIARRNNTVASRVERDIRHAFEIANSTRGDYENFEKYIGFVNTTNSAALISLYKHIKRESEGLEKEDEQTDLEPKGISPELEFAIRRIMREELKQIRR